MKNLIRFSLAIVLAGLLTLTGAVQDDLQKNTILLTFIPDIQFAPMYVTIAEGYFEEVGLDVSLEYLNEPDVVDLVAANRNQFGVVSGEQVILAAAQARPVVYIYEWFQQYPVGVVYSADRKIESVEDLVGLTVGIPGRFGATYSGFTTLLQSADVAESDVRLEEIGFAAPDVFCVGQVDASVIYVNNEPLQIRNRAQNEECSGVQEVRVLRIADVIDLVANGLISNEETIANNPELVQDTVGAWNQGLADTINNPARAYLLSADFVETLPLDDDLRAAMESLAEEQDSFLTENPDVDALYNSHQAMYNTLLEQFDMQTLIPFEVLINSIPLWNAERLGFSDIEAWENMQETLLALDLLSEAVDLSSIFTNAFVPAGD